MQKTKQQQKQQIWLWNMEWKRDHRCEGRNMHTNVNIWGWPLNTSWVIVFCIYTYVYSVKRYWHKEKEICLPKREFISGHICEGTNMAAKYEMFLNYSKNIIGICRIQMWLPNMEYIRDQKCERTSIVYKCKIFEVLNLALHGHYYFVFRHIYL